MWSWPCSLKWRNHIPGLHSRHTSSLMMRSRYMCIIQLSDKGHLSRDIRFPFNPFISFLVWSLIQLCRSWIRLNDPSGYLTLYSSHQDLTTLRECAQWCSWPAISRHAIGFAFSTIHFQLPLTARSYFKAHSLAHRCPGFLYLWLLERSSALICCSMYPLLIDRHGSLAGIRCRQCCLMMNQEDIVRAWLTNWLCRPRSSLLLPFPTAIPNPQS